MVNEVLTQIVQTKSLSGCEFVGTDQGLGFENLQKRDDARYEYEPWAILDETPLAICQWFRELMN